MGGVGVLLRVFVGRLERSLRSPVRAAEGGVEGGSQKLWRAGGDQSEDGERCFLLCLRRKLSPFISRMWTW